VRKDFILDTGHGGDESAFVEHFWTENWRRTGGVEAHSRRFTGRFDRFALKSEWRVMLRWLDRMPRREMLDGGCGTGEWTRYLTAHGYPTTGVDLSRETVAKLNEIFPDETFVVGDIRNTGIADATMGGYFSWGTFEHFEDGLQPCIREAYRVLAPGGLLFLTVPHFHLGLAIDEASKGASKQLPKQGERFYQWRLTKRDLALELDRAGFEVLELRPIHRRQGIVRFLHRFFGINYDSKFARLTGLAVGMVMPRALCAHMLMGVARKPDA